MANTTTVRDELGQGRTRDLMIRAARRVVGEHESEDVAHDAVVQALSASAGFREDARVGTWLHRIAVNAALMNYRYHTRAARRLTRAKDEAVDANWLGHPADTDTAAVALEGHEQRLRLRHAVAELPEAYREVIELCVYREQPPGDVAGTLGITPSAVRTRFSRAQDRLRTLLAARG
jgi:RNA polymerase sigma-70 factor (ECF subfamily)